MKRRNHLPTGAKPKEGRVLTERQFLRLVFVLREDTMARNQTIYSKFEAIEEQLAHCYFILQRRFIVNPPLAKFWAETAMDEMQHSSILRFCRERGLIADVDVDAKTIEHIEELMETVKNIVSDPEVSIDEAFYASLLMESSELDNAYEKLTGSLARDHRLLFDAIQASQRAHHGTLADAAEEFSANRGLAEAFRRLGNVLDKHSR
jgi:hypothetical protein